MAFWDAIAGLGSAAAGYQMAQQLGKTGEDVAQQAGELAGQLQNDTQFQGYGVTTGLGTSTVAPDGSTNLGVGQDPALAGMSSQMLGGAQGAYNQAQQMAGAQNQWAGQASDMMNQGYGQMAGAFGNIPQREQDIYNRAMAMQNPMLDAQQAQQQAREYAMGRGGVRGSQFGGTAEDAAMARARAQASNQASFQAMGQAQQEAMNQLNAGNQMFGAGAGYNQAGLGNAQLSQSGANVMANIGQGMGGLGSNLYGQSYMPMQQQLNAMQVAQGNAGMAQTGMLTGAGYGAQLGLGGLQAQINAEKAASELYGNLFDSVMDNAGEIGSGIENSISKGYEWFTDPDRPWI